MARHIAFLRGINVGGHRVKMDRLRELFEELGFSDVDTFIASGNVIFTGQSSDPDNDPAALEREIEHHLEQELGYEVATFIRSPSELKAIAAFEPYAPWGEEGPDDSLYVIFLPAPPDAESCERFDDLGTPMDDFQISRREIYWLIKGKLTDSPLFGAGLAKATGDVPNTTRNMKTVRRLVARYGSDD